MDKIKELMGLVDAYAHHERMQDAEASAPCREFVESKLRELLERERESCARICEQSDRYRGSYFAAKIRGMGNESKEMMMELRKCECGAKFFAWGLFSGMIAGLFLALWCAYLVKGLTS